MTESTFAMPEAMRGDDWTGSGDPNVIGNLYEAWGLSNGMELFAPAVADLGSVAKVLEEF